MPPPTPKSPPARCAGNWADGAAAMQPKPQAGQHANSRAPITLVTAYFALPRRSRTIHDYHHWMANLLPFVEWPMVIFCDEASLDIIKRLRGQKPAVYCLTRLEDFSVYRYRDPLHAHVAQRLGRPAEQTTGFDAALVWHEKPHFVRRAIDMNAFDSEMFFWCDIGLLRGGVFRPCARSQWPNFQVCRAALGNQVAFFGRHIAPPPPPPRRRRLPGFQGSSGAVQVSRHAASATTITASSNNASPTIAQSRGALRRHSTANTGPRKYCFVPWPKPALSTCAS